jgi:hypothetical protein
VCVGLFIDREDNEKVAFGFVRYAQGDPFLHLHNYLKGYHRYIEQRPILCMVLFLKYTELF